MISSSLQFCAARVIPEKANIPVALLHNYNLGTIMGDSIMKKCCHCKKTKPFSKFFKNRSTKDGYQSWCKICFYNSVKKYRRTEQGRATQERYRQKEKSKLKHCFYQKRYCQENKLKVQAHRAVTNAVKSGKLPRPDSLKCFYCPEQANQYHHYLGYAKEHWLDVIALSELCHKSCHSKIIKTI